MKKVMVIFLVLAMSMCVFCSCKGKPSNTDVSANLSQNQSSIESQPEPEPEPPINDKLVMAKTTSEQIGQIKTGFTYKQIEEVLGDGRLRTGPVEVAPNLRIYLVDQRYILFFNALEDNDVCEKSGEDFLETLVPATLPEKYDELKKNEECSAYGVVVDEYKRVYSLNEGGSYCSLDTFNAEIIYANGKPATRADFEIYDTLLYKFEIVRGSSPAQLVCTKIIILREN